MALVDIQHFITKYVRDANFRENAKQKGIRTEGFEFTKEEIALVHELNLEDLDKVADGFLTERLERRRKEFKEFFIHLDRYVAIKDFFSLYDKNYPKGLLIRALEMDRFLTWSTEYIIQRNLPFYLIDLLRFNYFYSKLCDTPLRKVDGAVENINSKDIKFYHSVQLKEPYKILNLRWDILSIAQSQPTPTMASIPMSLSKLFIQKDWSTAKVTRIKYASEIPFLLDLSEGPVQISELLARYEICNYFNLYQMLGLMNEQGIIHVTKPNHFNS